jgi:hypothetical protein
MEQLFKPRTTPSPMAPVFRIEDGYVAFHHGMPADAAPLVEPDEPEAVEGNQSTAAIVASLAGRGVAGAATLTGRGVVSAAGLAGRGLRAAAGAAMQSMKPEVPEEDSDDSDYDDSDEDSEGDFDSEEEEEKKKEKKEVLSKKAKAKQVLSRATSRATSHAKSALRKVKVPRVKGKGGTMRKVHGV